MKKEVSHRKSIIVGKRFVPTRPTASELKLKKEEENRTKKSTRPEPRPNPFTLIKNQQKKQQMKGSSIMGEIHKLQSTSSLLLPKSSFNKLVKSICEENFDTNFRWTTHGLEALQTSAE
jgi:hypothetical protein